MTKRTRSHRRAARSTTRRSLPRLPDGIEARLCRKALEQTAGIADPRFRALFVQRLMLRGHERRLFQLEARLWGEALRVNNGALPKAVLWIHQNHAEVVRVLGRYHAWICARISAVQSALRPYLAQQRARQAAATPAVFAAAAGSSRPIVLAALNEATRRPSARDTIPLSPQRTEPPCACRPAHFLFDFPIKDFSVTTSENLYFVSFQRKPSEIGHFS